MLSSPVCKGEEMVQENNIFRVYTLATDSLDRIQQAYLKMKLCNPKARHVICAYFVDGEDYHYTRGSCDDGEHGAGELLLNYMLENNLRNRVIFVTRIYSGKKIGTDRFKQLLLAANACMQTYPGNAVNDEQQEVPSEVDISKYIDLKNQASYRKSKESEEQKREEEQGWRQYTKRRRDSHSPERRTARKYEDTDGKGQYRRRGDKRHYVYKKQ